MLEVARVSIPGLDQKDCGLWKRECACTYYKLYKRCEYIVLCVKFNCFGLCSHFHRSPDYGETSPGW